MTPLFVLRWIKPSLFAEWDPLDESAPKDQWTYCETLGAEECLERLEAHWDTWVTESDVASLAGAGITHVRVPLGHWITCDIEEDEPYVCGEWKYLVRAAGWCRDHGVAIWLDLHTAPGSQNGFDNSGHLGAATWDEDPANAARTTKIVKAIAKKVKGDGIDDVVEGFGLLNEPDQHIDYWAMLGYYNDAYEVIRAELGDDVAVYIGDMFNPASFNWFWKSKDDKATTAPNLNVENVFLDSHIYACFTDDLKGMTPKQHVVQVCEMERSHISTCCWDGKPPKATELRRFVGEWTAAYDQTPSPELEAHLAKHPRGLSDDRKAFLQQYVLAQMMTYESGPDSPGASPSKKNPVIDVQGWFFWNFHMESDAYREWDYLRGVEEGWIPTLEKGVSVEAQFGLTCKDLERETQACTTGVVEPFPKIDTWKSTPCGAAVLAPGRGASTLVNLLAAVAAVGLAGLAAAGLYKAARAAANACKRGYEPLNKRKDFTEINELPPRLSVDNPISIAA